jgi:hypothetical protein
VYTHTYVRIHMQHNETIKHCLKKGRTERGKWKYDGGGKYTVCIYGIIKMKLPILPMYTNKNWRICKTVL